MKNEIKVPSLGESISEATIGQILAPTGTIVKPDAEVLELETDKVNQVLYAPQGGKVNLTVKSGDVVKIGQIIGTIESTAVLPDMQSVKAETPSSSVPSSPPLAPSTKETPQAVQQEKPVGEAIRYTRDAFLADLE